MQVWQLSAAPCADYTGGAPGFVIMEPGAAPLDGELEVSGCRVCLIQRDPNVDILPDVGGSHTASHDLRHTDTAILTFILQGQLRTSGWLLKKGGGRHGGRTCVR
jgi:hypothetical protein